MKFLRAGCGAAALLLLIGWASESTENELRLPPDLVFAIESGGPPPVLFSHTTHVAFTDRKCLVCHPGTFKILHPAHKTSHTEMDAGRSCGACHNGKDAFSTQVADACASCHVEPMSAPPSAEGTPQAASATQTPVPVRRPPPEVKLAAGPDSPGQVAFRHSSHRDRRCDRCHPTLFAMKSGGKPLDYAAMAQGATCGACHNGKEAFGVEDSDACDKCHASAGGSP